MATPLYNNNTDPIIIPDNLLFYHIPTLMSQRLIVHHINSSFSTDFVLLTQPITMTRFNILNWARRESGSS